MKKNGAKNISQQWINNQFVLFFCKNLWWSEIWSYGDNGIGPMNLATVSYAYIAQCRKTRAAAYITNNIKVSFTIKTIFQLPWKNHALWCIQVRPSTERPTDISERKTLDGQVVWSWSNEAASKISPQWLLVSVIRSEGSAYNERLTPQQLWTSQIIVFYTDDLWITMSVILRLEVLQFERIPYYG